MRETWDEAVIAVMSKRPRAVWELQHIYAEIERRSIVTDHHRETWGSQPNYHHWVRSALNRLRKAGRVENVGRAKWQLT